MIQVGRGMGLGRVLGIPLRLDLSWFAGLAVVVLLSRELWGPELAGPAAVLWSGGFAVAFFACVLVHELAHALAAVLVGGGAVATLWQRTPRWRPQVVLGLFLWRAAADGERSAARSELLAGRAERG